MRLNLIAECNHWWKLWSVRLAALAGVAAGFLTAWPNVLQELVAYVPEQWRPVASVLVALFVWGVPTLARLLPQKKLAVSDGQ